MTKEVRISIESIQYMEDNSENSIISTEDEGNYFQKNGKHYIIYDEENEEAGGKIKNTLKFNSEEFSITKTGAINTSLVLRQGHKNASSYHTSYGVLLIETDTKEISICEEEERITILAVYDLYINEEYTAKNKISVSIITIGK